LAVYSQQKNGGGAAARLLGATRSQTGKRAKEENWKKLKLR